MYVVLGADPSYLVLALGHETRFGSKGTIPFHDLSCDSISLIKETTS